MALTEQEKDTIRAFNDRQALLAPFKRVMEGWSVGVESRFQKRIEQVQLVASGDLSKEWRVQVIRKDHTVVAEFVFPEYGRLFDMRRVEYKSPPSAKEGSSLYEWVKSKAEQGQIEYSTKADRTGLELTNPKILSDITYRIARSNKFKLPRRRWYNKGKEASIRDLYDQLSDAALEALAISQKVELGDLGTGRRKVGRPKGSRTGASKLLAF